MTTQAPTAHTLIKCHEIQADFTLSRATIYRWMKEGKFPKPIHLGANMVRWKKSDIDNWLAEREAV
jgi:prophage regulatory protein|tara:strand:- start:467 stop:664 length:198 start_codon:yes stop_codon:yes gene_type:complete